MAEHYYSENQTSDERRFPINIGLKNDRFELNSSSGIFSKKEIDFATKLLIENADVGNNVLDLGCGYGVVGISILRSGKKNVNVTFSDVNERALELTRENLAKHRLSGRVIKSNLFENLPEHFDTILCNPPYAAGREVSFHLIEEAFGHLETKGTLQIVARHNKGGSVLSKKMKEVFGNVRDAAKQGGFHVYYSRKE